MNEILQAALAQSEPAGISTRSDWTWSISSSQLLPAIIYCRQSRFPSGEPNQSEFVLDTHIFDWHD